MLDSPDRLRPRIMCCAGRAGPEGPSLNVPREPKHPVVVRCIPAYLSHRKRRLRGAYWRPEKKEVKKSKLLIGPL